MYGIEGGLGIFLSGITLEWWFSGGGRRRACNGLNMENYLRSSRQCIRKE